MNKRLIVLNVILTYPIIFIFIYWLSTKIKKKPIWEYCKGEKMLVKADDKNSERLCEFCEYYKYSEYVDAKMCSKWKCVKEE